ALAPGAGDTSTMTVYSPSGSTYVQSAEYSLPSKFTAYSMQYNAGYIVCASQPGTGGWDVRIFKMQGTKPVSVDTKPYYNGAVQPGSYFVNYYSGAPAGYTSPGYINLLDAIVIRQAGKDYLIVCGKGLGDVYEIAGSDGITAAVQGRGGHANQNTPLSAGTAAVYGDPVTFSAVGTGSTASIPIVWNFGNPEALGDPNTATGFTGSTA